MPFLKERHCRKCHYAHSLPLNTCPSTGSGMRFSCPDLAICCGDLLYCIRGLFTYLWHWMGVLSSLCRAPKGNRCLEHPCLVWSMDKDIAVPFGRGQGPSSTCGQLVASVAASRCLERASNRGEQISRSSSPGDQPANIRSTTGYPTNKCVWASVRKSVSKMCFRNLRHCYER